MPIQANRALFELHLVAGITMKVEASDLFAYYSSLQALRRLMEEFLEGAFDIYEKNSISANSLEDYIEWFGTGGYLAKLSQQVDNHPLWGLDDIAELERVGLSSHVYRSACPTPTIPMIWEKMAPSWSTAVLNFCALGVLGVMSGLTAKEILVQEMCPPWTAAKPMSLSRLKDSPENFVSSICEHFTADVLQQLSIARVMLDREASWVYLEMMKSGNILAKPGEPLIGDNSKLQKVEKAIREILRDDPTMKQVAIAKKLRAQKLGIRMEALAAILKELRVQGVYQGEGRSPRK